MENAILAFVSTMCQCDPGEIILKLNDFFLSKGTIPVKKDFDLLVLLNCLLNFIRTTRLKFSSVQAFGKTGTEMVRPDLSKI